MSSLIQVLTSALTASPLLLVWTGMAAFASVRWGRQPHTSKLVLAAASLSFTSFLLGTALSGLMPTLIAGAWLRPSAMSAVYGLVGFVRSGLTAGAYLVLAHAAYQGRA